MTLQRRLLVADLSLQSKKTAQELNLFLKLSPPQQERAEHSCIQFRPNLLISIICIEAEHL